MTIAISCVVTFFLIAFIYTPFKSEILSMQTESRRLQLLETGLTNFEKIHGNVEDFAALIENRLVETRELIPAESLQDAFAAEIYKIADKNKILVDSIQIGDVENVETDNKNFFRQSVKIKVEGDYISTLNLIREILDGKRFVTVDDINLESAENVLSGDIELSIYHLTFSR